MDENISSCVIITFEPLINIPESLSTFLDSYFEVSSLNYLDSGEEQYVGYFDLSFDEEDLRAQAKNAGINLPSFKVEVLKNKNWLKENVIKFAPVEVADFCIYGIHEKQTPKTKKIPIEVYAATAFGSTHQTTHLCLGALADLARMGLNPKQILDVGTGSGILSIASAKKWQKVKPHILGVDIDMESLNVAGQNVFDNNVQDLIDVAYSNGFKTKVVRQRAPYDLIFANILARPLISMARDMARSLRANGYAVLSGFTNEQQDWVFGVYQREGFKLLKLYENEHWRAALLQKKEKLSDISARLNEGEAILIKKNNMFLDEDILETENKIAELSNFNGSAGMLLVLKNKTFLLVDGRYTLQARKQVLKGVEVVEVQSFFISLVETLRAQKIDKLLFNPWCTSESEISFYEQAGLICASDLSVPASNVFAPEKVFAHPVRFTGLSHKQKIQDVIKTFPKGFDSLLICAADEVSWLSNLRAVDLPYSPVLRAYALLKRTGKLKAYVSSQMPKLIADLKKCGKIIYQKEKTPFALMPYLQNAEDIDFDEIAKQKTKKNEAELQGFINAHIRDGVAVVKFLCDLEENYIGFSETDAVQKLHEFRAKAKNYFSESFATIAAFGANGAIVHYQPSEKTNKKFSKNGVFLLDSGGQYFDGTTDITRTIALGRVKKEIKKDFTLVLKAHIALANHIFEEKTPAFDLDAVCRKPLLTEGRDYKHGTGHGVGHFSNVHEGPFSINAKNKTLMMAGYVTSIEPGVYIENAYGIRIENLYYTKKCGNQLCFQVLTLCPIDLNLVDSSLLTSDEKNWLNNYHQKVLDSLKPFLNKKERLWLKEKCHKV